MTNEDDMSDTIKPKSDQLNADDLLTGPITVTIEKVTRNESAEQPVSLHIGNGRQPFKPCKSMRRVLIAAWGENGSSWVGKSLTLYADSGVIFGGAKVGGIRISHVSSITEPLRVLLTVTRSKRAEFVVKPLTISNPQFESATGTIEDVVTVNSKPDAEKAWTKWGIKINGETFGTFDKSIGESALALVGSVAVVEWKTDGKHKTALKVSPMEG